MKYEVFLPIPPSANKLWTPGLRGRMHRSQAYNAWRAEAGWVIAPTRRPEEWPAQPRYAVRIVAGIDYRRDLDNVIKPVLDCLQAAGIIHDDRYVDDITAIRDPSTEQVLVTVAALP